MEKTLKNLYQHPYQSRMYYEKSVQRLKEGIKCVDYDTLPTIIKFNQIKLIAEYSLFIRLCLTRQLFPKLLSLNDFREYYNRFIKICDEYETTTDIDLAAFEKATNNIYTWKQFNN